MTIAAILEKKGHDVVTIGSDARVRDAVALLAERRIGALAVVDEGQVSGIMSERDVVYCLKEHGDDILDRPVRDVMTTPAITIEPGVTVLSALSDMSRRRIRHLPVVENGTLTGMVSIGDLVAYRIRKIEAEAEAMRAYIQGG
ncbi:CBS domain-containing protein [Sphingosinicella sp. BN140058]|uniref:CBS domain-containing protein n=1 Tax=Sphingosinicella sp. BN140058 TaxID=1892855 RepID=UPI00101373B0|nr:CBS domain-containing protein [Sphingosinicella sp. BN140058]QAY76713.1 CBS domain-containing protein [Sphingosinicella sp. BN140058]